MKVRILMLSIFNTLIYHIYTVSYSKYVGHYLLLLYCIAERAAKVAEQQERDRVHHHTSPRAGTPVGALMGVVPPPIPMGMLNPSMTPVSGNPW